MTEHVHHWLLSPPEDIRDGQVPARCLNRGCDVKRRTFPAAPKAGNYTRQYGKPLNPKRAAKGTFA